MSVTVERNPLARRTPVAEGPDRAPLAFHRTLAGYEPSPLIAAPELAAALGIERVWLKDETARLSLSSFKILGASWAVSTALRARLGLHVESSAGIDGLQEALAQSPRRLALVAATDGNHGRAVARMASRLDLPARIFVPQDVVAARRLAIAGEGAKVIEVGDGYDAAVPRSAEEEALGHVIVSDTSWPRYEDTRER